jgi:hypothetical protein
MSRLTEGDDIFEGLPRRDRRALEKEMDRATRRAEKYGCTCCRVSLETWPLPYFVIFRGGTFIAICQACQDKLGETNRFAVVWETEPVWALDDMAWFEANPNRQYRLREPIVQELAAMALQRPAGTLFPKHSAILVWQKSPSYRTRLVVSRPLGSLPSFSEAEITRIFALSGDASLGEFTGGSIAEEQNSEVLQTGLERAGVVMEAARK